MSETANTLIKAAYRTIGVIASGETPTNAEMQDGLEALQFMFRTWSDSNIRLYYTEQDTVTLDGSQSYTIGSGGDCDTVRPVSIRGAYVRDSNSVDHPVKIIDEAKYRGLRLKNLSGTAEYLWYNPEYTLGVIYVFPTGGDTMYLDTLKPLTEPSALTDSVSFPPGYDEAIKWNLACRLAPEFGKEPSQMCIAFAQAALRKIESRNFAEQINAAKLEVVRMSGRYNISEG